MGPRSEDPSIELTPHDIIRAANEGFVPSHDFLQALYDKLSKKIDSLVESEKKEQSQRFFPGYRDLYYDGEKVSFNSFPESKKMSGIYDRYTRCFNLSHSLHYDDPQFTYNANQIRGTNFVAACGPQTKEELCTFFKNTVFNQKCTINKIIALGDKLSYWRDCGQDFYNYCIRPEGISEINEFDVLVTRCQGKYTLKKSGAVYCPESIIQSSLEITPKKEKHNRRQLEVTLIPLSDNGAFDLREDKENELKEMLWKTFQEVQSKFILVHCQMGKGRTGFFIFILELLRHYDAIFKAIDLSTAALKIHEIVNRMRETRPGLIITKEQFELAILNAHTLRQYALEKHYIVEKISLSSISVSKAPQALFSEKKQQAISIPIQLSSEDNRVSCRPRSNPCRCSVG
jgi:protein tyrosine phosphatase